MTYKIIKLLQTTEKPYEHKNTRICEVEKRSCDFHDLFSSSCNEDVGTDLHRTPETFLSCIHCRFSLTTLFPASPALDFFTSSRDNNTIEKFRGHFDRHDSQVLAPRGLISINCGAMLPPCRRRRRLGGVLQGSNSTRKTRHRFLRRQRDIRILYSGRTTD